jgi:predicted lysophospholipase L1 biosynthesis ABC-type transport system permease subunit
VRGSTPGDRPNLGAVIVSESLARTLWPGRDPLGERLHLDLAPAQSLSVVGVVHDVPSLLGTAAQKTVYQVQRARTVGDALLVRFDGDERQTAAAMRDAIAGLDPHAVVEPRTLGAIRRDAADRFMRIVDIVLFLAASALALAVMGIYGAVAFAVARRMKEIGIRIALGATPGHVTGIVLWTGWKPIAVGLGTGTIVAAIAAHAVARLFRGTPAEIDPSDPRAYINVALMLASAGTAAMIAPCRRAVSAEPAHALRAD